MKLFYTTQSKSFPTEKRNLLKNSPFSSSSKILQFFPFIGPQGLLRATGRTKKLDVSSFDAKHPVLVDSHHPVTRLFLENLHRTNCHQGVDYLRALVQQQFVIVKLRAALRTIVLRCVTCRKRRAETLSPMMADLPRESLAFKEPPFSNTGVDYFGPFYVSVRRSTEKRWGFLFTCLTTRAVHFEVVPSMDTSSCIMGIERFIARRGTPSNVWSDNGTNFIASEKELLQNIAHWNHQVLTDALVKKRISCKFNPRSAPHHVGVWERVVRSFKHVFYAVLGNRRLTDGILITFCLVEQSLKARPLVPASSDATDLDADVDMILGQDVFHFIRPLEYFDSDRKNIPVAVRLSLGWVLSGPLPSASGLFSTFFKAVTTNKDTDYELAEQLRSWYDIKSYGVFKQVDSRSASDARAEKILETTTYHDESRYQVGMLWAEDESSLPNNYFSALVQLKSLERRLGKDAELKERYTQTIKDAFSKGYIVEVDKSDCFKMNNAREWYLPHHQVVHPHKPGKVRRVLNGAAKFQGQSLNNALLTGPDLLQSLNHILFRFRQYPHAVSSDIEGMFLQVGVIPEDRPSLRFLWREDPSLRNCCLPM